MAPYIARTCAYGDVCLRTSTCVCAECVTVRSVYGLYCTVHRRTLTQVDDCQCTSPYHTSTCGLHRHAVPYARLTQVTQGPKHASNLTHAISCDKVQPCHWPLLAYVVFLALHALRCVQLETMLNAACQLREDVEWAKYKSNNVCVGRRGGVLSSTGHISRPFK